MGSVTEGPPFYQSQGRLRECEQRSSCRAEWIDLYMEGVRNGRGPRERNLDLDMPREGEPGGRLKPLLGAWARKDWSRNRAVSSWCVSPLSSVQRERLPSSSMLLCSLMLFCGWILFGEFKAGLSWVSKLALWITKSNQGIWKDQQESTPGVHFNSREVWN